MNDLSRAAHHWLHTQRSAEGAHVSIVDAGVAFSRRSGVVHHVADAAEITIDSESTLAAAWLCGGSTVDATVAPKGTAPDCSGCRIQAAVPTGPVVYYAWGEGDELLYVGSSIKVAQRIRNHGNSTAWWPQVRRLSFDTYDTELEARRAEMEAIAERPGVHNVEGRRGIASLTTALDGIEIDAFTP